ncbi:hypothetical protein F511_34516 [Dorcoceras hygrometricum]|uniref:Delphilin-like n=1 Tax=Dorcoceras hygrometricum TaxID=472368 RepID=A0A2Z7C6Y9_9LAMI|nr:hypothetical protein F511_34516 [Dorcoceras hygrometricum]
MALSLIQNALQINFHSVLSLSDGGMVSMFKALESFGLRVFLGCSAAVYEKDLVTFFENATMRGNTMTSVNDFPAKMINEVRRDFSESGELIKASCKKKEMKVEFRLLNDILAKAITAKAGSFDAVTQERFLLMAAIHYGIRINWSRFLYDIQKGMVTPSSKQARGFVVQLSFLLEEVPGLKLGESKALPPMNILTVKSIRTYIAKNKFLSEPADEVKEESVVDKVVTTAAKRRPSPAVEPVAKKKRTTIGRVASTLKDFSIVPVVQHAVSIFVVSAGSPRVQISKAPK